MNDKQGENLLTKPSKWEVEKGMGGEEGGGELIQGSKGK